MNNFETYLCFPSEITNNIRFDNEVNKFLQYQIDRDFILEIGTYQINESGLNHKISHEATKDIKMA